MEVIEVEGLCFEYEGKRVLHDVSFTIAQGNVTALVGPNGAGKTTLMRCMAALEKPVAGRIIIDGVDSEKDPRGVHRVMGYLSDSFGLYKELTVVQCLTYMAWSRGMRGDVARARVEEVIGLVGLEKYAGARAGTLSRGYRQRVGVGLALMHRPRILMLDEPASGLDPEARMELSQLMLGLRAEGVTVVVSSHILAELEDYCTDMLVIRDGRVSRHMGVNENEGRAQVALRIVTGQGDEVARWLRGRADVGDVNVLGDRVELVFQGDEEAQGGLLRALVTQGFLIQEFYGEQLSLQMAYMNLAKGE